MHLITGADILKDMVSLRFSATTLVALAAALALSCSADAPSSNDAGGGARPDARRGNGIPDANRNPPPRPDAIRSPDARPACNGTDTEPNDTPETAIANDSVSDCDLAGNSGNASGSVISGNQDWFTFAATDGICSFNPTLSFTGNVKVCMLLACQNGTTAITACPADTTDHTDSNGARDGCCGVVPAGFSIPDYACTGTINEDATVHLNISATSQDICEVYSVDYSF